LCTVRDTDRTLSNDSSIATAATAVSAAAAAAVFKETKRCLVRKEITLFGLERNQQELEIITAKNEKTKILGKRI